MIAHRVSLVIALVLATAGPAAATERLVRHFDGLGLVSVLAEGDRGDLWMGNDAGLFRHDGRGWIPVARELIEGRITAIVMAPQGVIVAEEFAEVWLVRDGEPARALRSEDGRVLQGPVGVAVDRDQVWIADAGGVHVGLPLALRRLPIPLALIAEVPRAVAVAAPGEAYVATRRGLWRVDARGAAERLTDVGAPARLLVDGDGLLHLAWDGTLSRWNEGGLVKIFAPDPAVTAASRGCALAWRGDTLWVAYDLALVALRPGRPPEVLGAAQGVPSGGPLLVDREGSLWLGTFRGLLQFPEPATVGFGELDGMPSSHGRFAAVTTEGVWLSTWQGAGLLRAGAARAETVDLPGAATRTPLCVDGGGRLWGGAGRHVLLRDHGVSRWIDLGGVGPHDCFADGGDVWFATDAGVFVVDATAATPTLLALPPPDRSGRHAAEQVAVDRLARLWITQGARACHTRLGAAPGAHLWTCADLPGADSATDLWPTPSGSVWIAARPHGVLRLTGAGFERLPGVDRLPSPQVWTLAPSPRGGVWLASAGSTWRVEEAAEAGDGWRVVERLGAWQGLMTTWVTHVAETAGGDLWMASPAGLIAMPAAARSEQPRAPAAHIVDVLVGGRRVDAATRVSVPSGNHALALHFAARTRRAPELVRFRVQIDGGAWSPPRTSAELQLVDVPSGSRTVAVAASLDGERWGEPDRFTFDVATPWYRRPLVWLAGAVVLAAALWALHRARVAMHVQLERQRLRIAMDLHDELGSGLGSIGVLAGVASLEDGTVTQREVAATIATTAADLGASLGDLVWSLRRGPCTLDELARRLGERARATFVPGEVELVVALEVPPIRLSPATARALQLIGQEALHNAGRHARARRVEIGLRHLGDRRWALAIDDDGVGIPDTTGDENGLGLTSMRRRARAIGANLVIGRGSSGRGTRVELAFDTTARDLRIASREAQP